MCNLHDEEINNIVNSMLDFIIYCQEIVSKIFQYEDSQNIRCSDFLSHK